MRSGVHAWTTAVVNRSVGIGAEIVLRGTPIGQKVWAEMPHGGNEFQVPIDKIKPHP